MTKHRHDRGDLIVEAIRSFTASRGFPPTIREIKQLAGLSSTASVAYQLQMLREAGRVRWIDGLNRTITVIEDAA